MVLAIAACTSFALPGNAECNLGGQIAFGPIQNKEAKLLSRINQNFENGRLNSREVARLTRDLDKIRAKEAAYHVSKSGMTAVAAAKIQRDLDNLDGDLDALTSPIADYPIEF